MSKIKKINLIKKKWILKGMWFLDIGSNPHSKGEIFSRSWDDFLDNKIFNDINRIEISININIRIVIFMIIYIKVF